MTISMEKQYTTRDGRPVRLLCVDGPGAYPVIGVFDDAVTKWLPTGEFCPKEQSRFDLIEVKPRVQCEVWVYRDEDGEHIIFDHEADNLPHEWPLVARVTIDVEEGHGLEGGH